MRIFLFTIALVVVACSSSGSNFVESEVEVAPDSTEQLPIAQPRIAVEFETGHTAPHDSVLTQPIIFDSAYFEVEREGRRLALSERWYHFQDTSFMLTSRVECQNPPEVVVTDLVLYSFPDTIDVKWWMSNQRLDWVTPYNRIKPDKSAALSGSIQFSEAEFYIEQWGTNSDWYDVLTVGYRLNFKDLVFANGIRIPGLESERYRCFPEGEYWEIMRH